MKTFLTVITFLALALGVQAADRKDNKKDRDKPGKEAVMQKFNVVITGATETSTQADLRSALGSIEGVKVDSFESSEKECVAVLESKERLSRTDIGKAIKGHSALKENKDIKVTDFKMVRPGKEDKDKEKDDKKDGKKEEEKKEDKAK